MGAQPSSTRGHSSNDSSRTCYYQLLGVEPQAPDQEIKKAYRRKALELHPDRNLDNVDVATKKFAEIQSAYEVLSDPQERAWYDSHRDVILNGQDGTEDQLGPTSFRNIRLTTTEEILGLIRQFSAATSFNDEPTGFFGIAKETFEHLALEEEVAADFEGDDCPVYPTFGGSHDRYETIVRIFYSSWAGFSTKKSFSWKDKYRLSDATDRRVRRLMERENKKSRDEAIREFNDAVRFLVHFVRKRDPRYLPNSQTEFERHESLRSASAAQAARSRAAHLEKMSPFEVPEWARTNNNDPERNDIFSGEDSEEESEVEILECVVCKKSFKSEQQLEAHERSKKHTKALQQLRRQMQKEGRDFALGGETAKTNETQDGNEDDGPHFLETRAQPAEPTRSSEASVDGRTECAQDLDSPHKPRISQDRSTSDRSCKDASTAHTWDHIQSTAPISPLQAATLSSDDVADSLINSLRNVSIGSNATPEIKLGKAKAKRQRKAAASQAAENEYRCSICHASFASRTKLFHHIHAENHMAPPSEAGHGSKNKRKG